jgi:hypothetical protein
VSPNDADLSEVLLLSLLAAAEAAKMNNRTSFKQLLKVQATPESGGGLGKIKEHRDRLQDLRKQAPPSAAPKRLITEPAGLPPKRPAPMIAAASSAGAGEGQGFIPVVAFAGPRAGYVFKRGAMGTGYYRDSTQPLPPAPPASVAGASAVGETLPAGFFDDDAIPPPSALPTFAAPSTGRGAATAAAVDTPATGSLPAGFFDNPREDPANARQRAQVSETQQGERLRQELASFEKSIEAEVQVADAVDELEDEADAEFRAAENDREQEIFAQRMRALREQAERVRALERAAREAAPRLAAAAANGSVEAHESSDSDLEDGDELIVDWRSKALV